MTFQPSAYSEASDLSGTSQRPVWLVPTTVGGLILLVGLAGIALTGKKKGKKK